MLAPNIITDDERARLAAVRRYDILDTPPDGAFDRITALAARLFDVPIAIVSIVDSDRIWFKSHHGVALQEIGRDAGLCASAILQTEPHILLNAAEHSHALANPLVAGDFGLRFYAGVPLRTSDGFNLGTLCVIDKEERTVRQEQIENLKDLASIVMDQIELRLAARTAVSRAEIMAREIDHRVMNSLHFISGILTMQSKRADMSDPQHELRSAAQRVSAIARVHRNFYVCEPAEAVACSPFLISLCADMSAILGKTVTAQVAEGCSVSTEKLTSIGLIVNELVTNAAKHGEGNIEVHYELVDPHHHRIRVCDEGPGLPDDFDFEHTSHGLGMKIVTSLAAQLSGDVRVAPIDGGRGACISVRFPG